MRYLGLMLILFSLSAQADLFECEIQSYSKKNNEQLLDRTVTLSDQIPVVFENNNIQITARIESRAISIDGRETRFIAFENKSENFHEYGLKATFGDENVFSIIQCQPAQQNFAYLQTNSNKLRTTLRRLSPEELVENPFCILGDIRAAKAQIDASWFLPVSQNSYIQGDSLIIQVKSKTCLKWIKETDIPPGEYCDEVRLNFSKPITLPACVI